MTILIPSISNLSMSTPHNHIENKRRLKNLTKLREIIIPSSKILKINLVEPILFIRGNPEESVGCFLRGELCLNLSNPMKIKKIKMKFVGKMKTFWPEGNVYHGHTNPNSLCETRTIFSHDWNFLAENNSENSNLISSSSSSYSYSSNSSFLSRYSNLGKFRSTDFYKFPAGTFSYPFELFIPGYLPETIEAERGVVTYKLVATIVRQGFSPNLLVTQYVPIIRTLLDEQISDGIILSKNWNQCLNYDISIPKKAYSLGDLIDIDLKLTFLAKELNIINLKIQLNQEATYQEGPQKYEESKILNLLQLDDYGEKRFFTTDKNSLSYNNTNMTNMNICDEENDFYYQKCIKFPIPRCTSSSIHHSCTSSSIIISHQLKFIFTIKASSELLLLLANENLKRKKKKIKMTFDIPITLLSCRCLTTDELPIYEESEYHCNNYNARHNAFNSDSVDNDSFVVDNSNINDSNSDSNSNSNNSNGGDVQSYRINKNSLTNISLENLDIESPPNYEYEF